jgi:hypothetical protein
MENDKSTMICLDFTIIEMLAIYLSAQLASLPQRLWVILTFSSEPFSFLFS